MDKYTLRAAGKLLRMFIITALWLLLGTLGLELLGPMTMGMLFLFGVAVMFAYTYITDEADVMRIRAERDNKVDNPFRRP
jgi:hypothetical protein